MKNLQELKKEEVQLSNEFHDLILQVKDNDLFLKLIRVVCDKENNSYQLACEETKAIYKN